MATVTVIHNQSLQDLAIQLTGSAILAFSLAVLNNISITEALVPGTVLQYDDALIANKDVYNYYQKYSILPATALSNETLISIDNSTTSTCDICSWFL